MSAGLSVGAAPTPPGVSGANDEEQRGWCGVCPAVPLPTVPKTRSPKRFVSIQMSHSTHKSLFIAAVANANQ